jgi:hypothetical protein
LDGFRDLSPKDRRVPKSTIGLDGSLNKPAGVMGWPKYGLENAEIGIEVNMKMGIGG